MKKPDFATLAQTTNRFYSRGEEIFHSISHGVGAALSAVGLLALTWLAWKQGSPRLVISFFVFGLSLTLLYLASTLYHGIQKPRWKQFFRILDHSAIYLLIAGTYTPFLLVRLQGMFGWTFLAVIWGLALLGIGFKALFIHRFQRLSVLGYVLMGWLGVIFARQVMAQLPEVTLIWLATGGFFYTVGVIFYAWKRLPYNHAIWHLFVMGGSACHYLAVYHLLR